MPSKPLPTGAIEVFYSYAHEDEKLRDELNKHLANLKRQGIITDWYDRDISAGKEWDDEIKKRLDAASVILLLISPDFMDSDYCNDVEVEQAMKKHESGEARVIPVILRPVDWDGAPFSKLQALPTNAKPVSTWKNRDKAFLEITKAIRKAIKEISNPPIKSSKLPEIPKPSKLPQIPRAPIIGFVARRDEQGRDLVELLKEELAPQGKPPVTLSGPGGVGKTTLAAEAARGLEGEFQGRIVWSSAEGRADFTLSTLLDDIVTQLGRADMRTLVIDTKAVQVHELICNPPVLVVLDNHETISEEGQELIEAWLTQAPCSALITSRSWINTTRNIKVAAMSREEAQEFLEKVIKETQDSQIFTEKIRQRIYETAEANPYVMQWVVGQIDQDVKEPDKVLEELTHGKGDAAQRVFERSYKLAQLGEDERAALLALSLFAPSASREALAAVAGFDDSERVKEAVKNLRALWLIKATDENRRFTIEGLTRSLALARLSKDERATQFRQRFIFHFLNYAEAHAQRTSEDFDSLESEKDNLLNAMDVAFNLADWASITQLMSAINFDGVNGFLTVRGYWHEVIRKTEQALRAARNLSDERLVARFIHNLAVMYQFRGELAKAKQLYDESLQIRNELNDLKGIALTVHQLGRLAQEQNEIDNARQLYKESLRINRQLGDQRRIATALHDLGRLWQGQGEMDKARKLYDESLKIRKELGDQRGTSTTSHALATLLMAQKELTEARRLYDESLTIIEELGDKNNLALIFYNLGVLERKEGNKVAAARLWRESLIMFDKLGSPKAEKVRRALERLEGEAGGLRD